MANHVDLKKGSVQAQVQSELEHIDPPDLNMVRPIPLRFVFWKSLC